MNILYVNSLEANNKELARQLASANVLIAEQNKLAKERQEWALHTNEVIGKLNQQLTAMTKERDKAKAMPMKYRRMEFNAQLQNENESLRQQLDATQKQNVMLREALNQIVLPGVARSISVEGMSAKDIAQQALAATEPK